MASFASLLFIGLALYPTFSTAQSTQGPSCNTWTSVASTNYNGGSANSAATVDDCKAACINNANCVAVDFNTDGSSGQKCWILTNLNGQKFTTFTSITHYDLARTCSATGASTGSSCNTWTPVASTNYNGGTANSAATVDDCKTACINNASCVAVDFNTAASSGQQCWILTSLTGQKFTAYASITHYDLARTCSGTTTLPVCYVVWTKVSTTNYAGGNVNSAGSLADCQSACLSSSTCIAVDFNSVAPVGSQCWFLTSMSGTKFNIPGIDHYDLNRCSTVQQSPYFVVLAKVGKVVTIDPTGKPILSDSINDATIFTATTPCLATSVQGFNNSVNCTTWSTVDGLYLRNLYGNVVAQSQSMQYFPPRFAEDASFIVIPNQFTPGFFALQPAVYPASSSYYYGFFYGGSYLTASTYYSSSNQEYASFLQVPYYISSSPVTTTCPNVWSRVSGAWSSQTIPGGSDITSCRQKCLVYPNCVGVTLKNGNCYLETNSAVVLKQDTTSDYFELSKTSQRECSRGCFYTFAQKTSTFINTPTTDDDGVSSFDCRYSCTDNSNCLGISWKLNSTTSTSTCTRYYPSSAYGNFNGTVTYWAKTVSFDACGGCDPTTIVILNSTDSAAVKQTGVTGLRNCFTACINNRLCTGYDVRGTTGDCYLSLGSYQNLNASDSNYHVEVTLSDCGNGCRDKWSFYGSTTYSGTNPNAAATESACRIACQADSTCIAASWNYISNSCALATSSSTLNSEGTSVGWNTYILYRQPFCDND